ncbi:hypothetical protein HHK36_031076 [Tetracentron sinense]|uniref:GH10 domain-containing protein n=1 Tax=Tetracentron sinense TaxID=13715 RepID=A0A835CYX1_TETSI|nr:hypothetical protein HHK36_031076 [Tetracentron sinense]
MALKLREAHGRATLTLGPTTMAWDSDSHFRFTSEVFSFASHCIPPFPFGKSTIERCVADGDENIILNPQFEDGLNSWSGRGCKILVHDSMGDGKILPLSGKFFASATEREQSWNGIQQEITGRIHRKLGYQVTAVIRIFGNNVVSADVRVTLWVQTPNLREQYISIANLQAKDKDWVQLQGKFLLNGVPSRVVIYFEGPPPGTDILIDSLVVKHAAKVPPSPPPVIKNASYGVNIVENSNLSDGLKGWFPLAIGPQIVNVALGVDSQWVNGGQVEANDVRWHEIGGSFRIEKQPSKVMVYIQGPSGVNLMVAGLQIFPVDRQARFKHLKRQTDKIRKRDVVLKFSGSEAGNLLGTCVKVRQTHNSFPLGSCINRTNIDNEDFVDFFVKNFNWSVFGNELKWPWTEPQEGNFNYKDADELLDLCKIHNIEARGHCIFWEVEYTIQSWVRSLSKNDLMKSVRNRLTGLLTRYKEKFRHYDVNNEMLHGSFYQDRIGKDTRPYMFKTAHQLDPSATLFVNDYHIEDGCDSRSSPEKYT